MRPDRKAWRKSSSDFSAAAPAGVASWAAAGRRRPAAARAPAARPAPAPARARRERRAAKSLAIVSMRRGSIAVLLSTAPALAAPRCVAQGLGGDALGLSRVPTGVAASARLGPA